jgi:branched-chain amino acid transport system substrate-binding protein
MKRRHSVMASLTAASAALLVAACSSTSSGSSSSATSPAAAGTASSVAGGTKSALLLGVDGGWSGPTSESALPELAGVKAWAAWVNAQGGLDGHPVQLIVEDDQGNPATGLANVEDLVQNKHVIALVGVHANSTEPTWASYVESRHIPVVGGEEDTAVWVTNPDFFLSAEPGLGVIATEAYVAKLAGGGFATVNLAGVQDVGPLLQAFQAAAAKDGVAYRFHTTVSAASPNYTAACVAAEQSGAKVVGLQLDPNTGGRVSADCYAQGYKPTYLVPSGAYAPEMLGQPQFSGTYVPSPNFLWFASTPVAARFRTAMAKYQPGSQFGPNSTAGWAAGLLFQAAAAHIGANPTSQDILNGLYALPANDTLGGASPGATFSQGKQAVSSGCFFLAQIQGGKLTAPKGNTPVCPSA